MRRLMTMAAICAVALSACASNPKKTLLKLDAADPAYASADCRIAREAALKYNDHVLGRAGMGLALGLLGPLGLPIAAGIDINQNNERKMMNDVVTRDCASIPRPQIAATAPAASRPSEPVPRPVETQKSCKPSMRVLTDPAQNAC